MSALIHKYEFVGLDSITMTFMITPSTISLALINLFAVILVNDFLLNSQITSLISDIFDRGILRATYISLHLASATFQEPSVFFVAQNLCT